MLAGNIGAWQKKPGDALQPGDVLVEIETDKAQMDFEFQDEGVLAKVLKETGEKEVAVGSVCAMQIFMVSRIGFTNRVSIAYRRSCGRGYRCFVIRVIQC
jgi:hypothetical protein